MEKISEECDEIIRLLKLRAISQQEYFDREIVKAEQVSRGLPRNSYMLMDLREPSYLSESELESVLRGTGLEGLGRFYLEAERREGVNALFLVCLSVEESGWGNSKIAQDKNNLFGHGAYNDSPYDSAFSFGSKKESIDSIAKTLKASYLTEGGSFFNGYTLRDVNVRYAVVKNGDGSYSPNLAWSNNIARLMEETMKRIVASN